MGRNWNAQKIHTCTRKTCQLHTEKSQLGFEPGSSLCKARALTIAPLYSHHYNLTFKMFYCRYNTQHNPLEVFFQIQHYLILFYCVERSFFYKIYIYCLLKFQMQSPTHTRSGMSDLDLNGKCKRTDLFFTVTE